MEITNHAKRLRSTSQTLQETTVWGGVLLLLLLCLFLVVFIIIMKKMSPNEPLNWDSTTELVVVVSHFHEDLNWLKKCPYPLVVYSKIGSPVQVPYDLLRIRLEDRQLLVNKGREAHVYLYFIVQHYDHLPQYIAFLHGHETAWHQKLDILQALHCSKRQMYHFISLNLTFIDDRRPNNNIMEHIYTIWEKHFQPYLHRNVPEVVYHDCCAQFIVSREAVQKIPKEAYQHWLDWLLDESTDGNIFGYVFEYLWHVIFGESFVFHENIHEYVKTRFHCDVMK